MKIFKLYLLYFYILLLPTVLLAVHSPIQLSLEEEQWIQNHPIISVANDPSWAPFDFTQEGKAQGLGVDYMELVAHKVGLHINYIHAPWTELIERFKVRNIDVIHSVYKTKEREKFALFTQSFYENANAIVMRKGSNITTLKDLEHKRVALIKGHGLSEILLKEVPLLEPIEVNDLKEALHAVSFNKADVLISSLGAISYIIMEEALPNLDIEPFDALHKDVSSQLYFATTSNQSILRDILNKGLQAITPQEQTAIKSRWLFTSNTNASAHILTLTEAEKQWLHNHPIIRFSGRLNYLPYEAFKNDGTYVGIMSDHLNIIEKKVTIHFDKQPSHSSSEIETKVNNHQIDVFSSFKDDHTFDATHQQIDTDIKSPIIIVGRKQPDNRFIAHLDLLQNEKVAIINDSPYAQMIRDHYPHMHYVGVKDIQSAFEGVASGKYTFMLSSLAQASYKLNDMNMNNLQIVGNTGYTLELCLSIPKEWSLFAGILKKVFEAHQQEMNLSHNDSMHQWENITLKPKTDYTFLLEFTAIFCALLLILFYWNYLLKKKVAQKTIQFTTLLKTFDTHIIASKTDLKGNITYVSDALCTISGYKREELIGQKHRFLNPDNPDSLFTNLWDTISQGHTWQGRIKNTKKQEGFYWVDSLVQHDHDVKGNTIGYITIMHDVTAHVALEALSTQLEQSVQERTQALAQLNQEQKAIFDTASVGIFLLKDRMILNCNHHLNEMFGYEQDEQVGQYTRIWYKDEADWIAGGAPVYETLRINGIQSREQIVKRKDGTLFWTRITLKEIDPNHDKGVVGVIEDITFEKAAIEEIKKAKIEAENATKIKSNFLANMSHEIRTPMNAIIGMSHLMFQTSLETKQRNYLEKIDNAAKHLLHIINDILDFSKIESGKMGFETIDFFLEDVMEQLSDLCVMKAQEKGLEVLFDIGINVPTALKGDPLRLGQILINLVNNAIKFTVQGEIKISIHVLKRSDTDVTLVFDISDTGIGMSTHEQEKLFQAFSQADLSTTRKYGGSGLGLAISKHLVEMMKGSIGVKSALGKGSTFVFDATFQLQKEQKRIKISDKDAHHLRILVVDDNQSSRIILDNILSSFNFEVDTVSNGTQALLSLQKAYSLQKPYGLVLMDWMMPEMNGIETIQKIREISDISQTLAFIMITSYSKEELKQELEDNHINDILIKPINPSTLLNAILSTLGKDVVIQSHQQDRKMVYREALNMLRGASILLVEDNLINQELAVEILENAGLHVDIANNGYEAVLKINEKTYDGVLMDCQMPVMDGFEATRTIREDNRNRFLPILAMTANAMSGDKERCLMSGMNDHITKPIDIAQLFLTMAKHIKPSLPSTTIPLASNEIEADEEVHIPELFGINPKEALSRMNNNSKIFLKLLIRFAQTQENSIERIIQALKDEDFTLATREAHTRKGLAGNIGANILIANAEKLEHCLVEHAIKNCDTLLDETNLLVHQICHDIVQKCTVLSSEQAHELHDSHDSNELLQECHTLKEMLDDLDPDATDFFETLLPHLHAIIDEKVLMLLQQQIHNFNYDEAKTMVELIEKTLSS